MAFQPLNMQSLVKFNSALSSNLLDVFENALDGYILNSSKAKPSKTFAPSSMRCERISWFRLRGVEPDGETVPDRGLDFTAKMGVACHEYVQSLLSQTPYWVNVYEYIKTIFSESDYHINISQYETQISLISPPIRFACDGILNLQDNLSLLEIKSCSHSSFVDLTDPKPEHVYQAKGYCTLLKLSKILFLYIDRWYGDIKVYEVCVTENDKQSILNMFSRVLDCVDNRIAPQPLPKGDRWCNASMCNYYKKCSEYGR